MMKRKLKIEVKISILVLIASILCSIVFYSLKFPGVRRVFYFTDMDTKLTSREIRYLPKESVNGKYQLFIDELLLGPVNERFKPLFSPGTRTEFCFVRDNELYVNLSEDVIFENPPAVKIKDGISLFRENIFKNFKKIKKINLYINGQAVE